MLLLVYGNIYVTLPPPHRGILVNLRTFPEEISEETWGIFHSRGAPPCPTSAVAESFGKRCYEAEIPMNFPRHGQSSLRYVFAILRNLKT